MTNEEKINRLRNIRGNAGNQKSPHGCHGQKHTRQKVRAGMKFDRYRFVIDWTWLYFIPSIVLTVNEPMYCYHNFSISVHWLGFHIRWKWMAGGRK